MGPYQPLMVHRGALGSETLFGMLIEHRRSIHLARSVVESPVSEKRSTTPGTFTKR
jgi:hypothetical protein